ncbi:hypothetical protein [Thermoflexus hugenholtzii]
MWRSHAWTAFGLIGAGGLMIMFTLWRLYPDLALARLLMVAGMGLMAWGLLWFPMELLHRRGEEEKGEGGASLRWERIWRRSGWGALGIAALALLHFQRALRLEWIALLAVLLLGAELLWWATEPDAEHAE